MRPVYEFEVSDGRMEKAMAAYQHATKVLGREIVLDVFHELGLGDAIGYGPGEAPGEPSQFIIDMTKVQFCALAAALAAVVEQGGRQRLSDVS